VASPAHPFDPSPLCAIVDADAAARAGWDVVALAGAFLEGGARFLQVRAKHAASGWLLEVSAEIVRMAQARGALVVVNDRADVARLAAAGGVHVGQDDLGPRAVRGIVGAGAIVGLSTHDAVQVEAAVIEPIDYVAIGPTYETSTKPSTYAGLGLEGVHRLSGRIRARSLKTVAIGGITLERAAAVIQAGADSIAVISDLLAAGDPVSRVRAYLDEIGRALQARRDDEAPHDRGV
jgi:thiamine-phosphate pyrophosphorylase